MQTDHLSQPFAQCPQAYLFCNHPVSCVSKLPSDGLSQYCSVSSRQKVYRIFLGKQIVLYPIAFLFHCLLLNLTS